MILLRVYKSFVVYHGLKERCGVDRHQEDFCVPLLELVTFALHVQRHGEQFGERRERNCGMT